MNKRMKRIIATSFTVAAFALLGGIFSREIACNAEETSITLKLGELYDIGAGDNAVVTSDNNKIVSVVDGKIHGVSHGKTAITIDTDEGSKVIDITVEKSGFPYGEITMYKGERLPLCFTEFKHKDAKWKTSNKKVAKLSGGEIVAKKVGKATAKCTINGKTYACHIKVKKAPKKVVYLTFDDGPTRSSTPKILKILKKNNVKATFFEINPAKADYDLTKKIIKSGHTLAVHGYSHNYNYIYASESRYKNNITKLQKLFFKKFGVWTVLTRFPGGSSNMVSRFNRGIMTRLTKSVKKWGYKYFDWNVSSADAGGAKNPKQVYKSVKRGLHKGENVVLMHDFANNYKTINALNKVIKYGKKHGYVFKAMTAATTEIHHGVNN
ncbi:MAG: polysaccharide deacetylase family protein [Eubacterium sp.]|nr:polysaccharide deacetylase family protein [Eubacterium sp.]